MALVRWVRRAYHHPLWIPALSAVAIISLIGTMILFVMFVVDQRAERLDRVEDTIASCERGNLLRSQVVDIGQDAEDLDRQILSVLFRRVAPGTAAEILAELEPVFDRHQAELDKVKQVDCRAAVNGN